MSRSLTSNALTKATTKTGTKPLLLAKVEWDGPQWFSAESFTVGTITPLAWLASIGDLSSQLKDRQVGSVSSIELVLNDPHGSLKTILDNSNINGNTVSVYQHFDGNGESDLTLVFKGKLLDPVWSEGERQVSFSCESTLTDGIVGFSVDDTSVSKDARKKMWPLCFGNPIKVPALRTEYRARATLSARFYHEQTSFTVDDSSEFPQSEIIKVIIEGIVFIGSFSGNTFTVNEANVPKYQSLGFGTRPLGDPDVNNQNVAWLSEFVPIANHYIMLQNTDGRFYYFKVAKQEDTKIYVSQNLLTQSGNPILLDTTRTILQVAKHGRIGWVTQALPFTRTPRDPVNWSQENRSSTGSIVLVPYSFQAGTRVVEWSETKPDVYVCNELPGTIKAVHADRSGREEQVPTQYYTKHESYSYHGKTCTVLKFKYPLEIFEDQGWSNEIYVTQESSQGQNTADQIKYLLDTYSDISTDSGSFSAVASGITNYPSNFAILEKQSVVPLCEEIAYQARCGLVFDLGTCVIKYLSAEPGFTFNAGRSFAHYKSLVMKTTPLNDIVTRYTGTWREDYRAEKLDVIHEENLSRYGTHVRTTDFWIYNIQSLVEKSVEFWGHRLANVWKVAVTKRFMPGLQLTLFDKINYQISELGPDIKGFIQALRYNVKERSFDVEVHLGALAGTTTLDSTFWTTDGESAPSDPSDKYSETNHEYQWTNTLTQVAEAESRAQIQPGMVSAVFIDAGGIPRAQVRKSESPLNKDGSRDVYI